ncbi:MAG TPA: TetR/AcrR family transcriptional regulator, partial [Pseudorhodoferax sp.]|nr:TetR/AcrR family transcriptional regulator [Pseudorhodoferax sp.]
QALLYKYFPNKQLLVEAVFETVFRKQNTDNWLPMLRDRSVGLRQRLVRFFTDYANTTYDYDWIRIYTQAAFSGGELNKQYIGHVTRPLLQVVAQEVRLAHGLALADAARVSELEVEVLWQFHFGIYYHPYRTHVYGAAPPVDIETIIEASVDGLVMNLQRCIDRDGTATAA